MQFDNQKTRNVADVVAKILAGESAKQEPQMLDEELVGNQHKIDANKNGKVDAHDFKLLRAKKKMKEETELTESHFKVGDEVICKASGMEGEVVKLDEPQTGKYYTVKREDGKMIKYAPDELKKDDEKEEMKESEGASKSQETKFHKELDTLVHKTFGKRKEEMKEESELDEAMFPGTKEYEKKYGQSPQQKLKKKGDTVPTSKGEMKKTEKGVMHTRRFSEMLQTYQQVGLKMISEMSVEEEADNEDYTSEVERAKAKDRGGNRNDKNIAAGKVEAVKEVDEEVELDEAIPKSTDHALVHSSSGKIIAKGNKAEMQKKMKELNAKEKGSHYVGRTSGKVGDTFGEEVELDEREMTNAEMKKKEEIVKSMKKGMAGFKQRYGDRAKEVMYATATKQAMKD